jgi:hypothetical protein
MRLDDHDCIPEAVVVERTEVLVRIPSLPRRSRRTKPIELDDTQLLAQVTPR